MGRQKNLSGLPGTLFAEMLEISDRDILEASSGIVSNWNPQSEDDCEKSLTDETIFADNETSMGHITLARPAVNIQYLFGKRPRIARALGMKIKDVEKVVYFSSYVVTDAGTSGLADRQVLSIAEYKDAREQYGNTFSAGIGASAIETLLERYDVRDREYMILHHVPVLPAAFRKAPIYAEPDRQGNGTINILYENVMCRNGRLLRLLELGAPEVIIQNETRILQEAVDALIGNGYRGLPGTDSTGFPCWCMEDVYDEVKMMPQNVRSAPDVRLDISAVREASAAARGYMDSLGESGTGEPYVLSKEEEQRSGELDDAVRQAAHDFCMAYMEENYPEFPGWHERAFRRVTEKFPDYVAMAEQFKPDNCVESEQKRLEISLMRLMDTYMKRGMPWDVAAVTENREKEEESA